MTQPEQKLHIVMDESDAPYEEDQYTRTIEDDISLVCLAEKNGLKFAPGSELDKLAKALKAGRIPAPPAQENS